MAILQRCQHQPCRNYFKLTLSICPRCGTQIPRGLKFICFRKTINGKIHHYSLGRVPVSEAEVAYGEWVKSFTVPLSVQSASMRWSELAGLYIEKLKSEGKTIHSEAKRFTDRMSEFCGDSRCNQIPPEIVKQFHVGLRSAGLAPSTCDKHIKMLSAAWNYVLPDTPNPFKRVKLYNPDNTLVRYLTDDEESRILEAAKGKFNKAPKHLYAIILLAIDTGMREQNILRLRADEVHLDHGVITVRQKRDLSATVVVSTRSMCELKSIYPEDAGYFFVNPRTKEPYGDITKTFKEMKRRAGITKPFRFHDFRHHCAFKLARYTNGNVLLVKEALQHRDIKTSLKYIHTMRDQVREAVEAVSKAVNESER